MQIDSEQIIRFGTKHNSPGVKAPLAHAPAVNFIPNLAQVLYLPLLYSFLLSPCFPGENKHTHVRDESRLLLKKRTVADQTEPLPVIVCSPAGSLHSKAASLRTLYGANERASTGIRVAATHGEFLHVCPKSWVRASVCV